jgi:hypothetical protein
MNASAQAVQHQLLQHLILEQPEAAPLCCLHTAHNVLPGGDCHVVLLTTARAPVNPSETPVNPGEPPVNPPENPNDIAASDPSGCDTPASVKIS